jgi:hypothetical protein
MGKAVLKNYPNEEISPDLVSLQQGDQMSL